MARVLKHFDSAIIAWAFYAMTRVLDALTTAAAIELFGRDMSIEANLVPRMFMATYGVHLGNLVHEIAVLGGAILAYVLLAEARRNLPVFRLAHPRIVPYTIGAVSALLVSNNLWRLFG